MDFLGWYTTGDCPDDGDIKIHKQICEINESPVLLKLNPQARHSDVSTLFAMVRPNRTRRVNQRA
jgi:COP9 signalosome complex subunit 6